MGKKYLLLCIAVLSISPIASGAVICNYLPQLDPAEYEDQDDLTAWVNDTMPVEIDPTTDTPIVALWYSEDDEFWPRIAERVAGSWAYSDVYDPFDGCVGTRPCWFGHDVDVAISPDGDVYVGFTVTYVDDDLVWSYFLLRKRSSGTSTWTTYDTMSYVSPLNFQNHISNRGIAQCEISYDDEITEDVGAIVSFYSEVEYDATTWASHTKYWSRTPDWDEMATWSDSSGSGVNMDSCAGGNCNITTPEIALMKMQPSIWGPIVAISKGSAGDYFIEYYILKNDYLQYMGKAVDDSTDRRFGFVAQSFLGDAVPSIAYSRYIDSSTQKPYLQTGVSDDTSVTWGTPSEVQLTGLSNSGYVPDDLTFASGIYQMIVDDGAVTGKAYLLRVNGSTWDRSLIGNNPATDFPYYSLTRNAEFIGYGHVGGTDLKRVWIVCD